MNKTEKSSSAVSVPFNIPPTIGTELGYIKQAIENQKLSGEGSFNRRCNEFLLNRIKAKMSVMLPSCTSGLEMAMVLADIKPGDEVIMPSFTFTSTSNAVVLFGGVPVFVDIEPETMNIDANEIAKAITPKTKAIIPVHYAGIGCDMKRINEMAQTKNIFVIEDSAQGMFASRAGRELGAWGDMAAISFHETKNIVCGEGGALMINSERLLARAEMVRDKGTNRQQFLNGQVDKYTWQDKGGSYLLSELSAAFLLAQLEAGEQITNRRLQIAERYRNGLMDLAKQEKITLMGIPSDAVYNGHIFYFHLRSNDERGRMIQHLKSKSVSATTHYVPLHSAPAGVRFGRTYGNLAVTDDLAGRALRMPMFYSLSDQQVDHVIESVHSFFR